MSPSRISTVRISFSRGLLLQPVGDDDAVRRVLPDGGCGDSSSSSSSPPPIRTVGRGAEEVDAPAAIAGLYSCSGVRSSRIQNERPCVATTRSFVLDREVGDRHDRQVAAGSGCQLRRRRRRRRARSRCPRRAGPRRDGSSRTTRVKAVVRDAARRSSSTSCRSRSSCRCTGGSRRACTSSRRCTPRPCRAARASIELIWIHSGHSLRRDVLSSSSRRRASRARGRRRCRPRWCPPRAATPRARRSCRRPRRPCCRCVIGPPELPCFDLSLRVRSGLISSQICPSSRLRRSICAAWYSDVRVVRRDEDRRVPLEAVLQVLRRLADRELRPRHDLPRLAGLVVVAGDRAAVAAGEDDVGVLRLRRDPAALAAADGVPVRDADPRRPGCATRDRDGRVVLLRAVDAVREPVVGGDAIELRRRLVHDRRPASARR